MWPAERQTPDLRPLLQPAALDQIGAEILKGGPRAIRYRETGQDPKSMVFVAHREDVIAVLMDEAAFSLCHYNSLYSAVAPEGATIIMRPEGPERRERLDILEAACARTPWFGSDPTARREAARACVDDILASVRSRRPRRFDLILDILEAACARTPWFGSDPTARREPARACVDEILASVGRRRRFDLIAEYGFFAPYLIAKRMVGLGAPQSLSLLPLLLCLANRHPVSWLLDREKGPYLIDAAWSQVVVAQLLLNFENRQRIVSFLARCGATHLRRQIEYEVDSPATAAADDTLLNALRAVRSSFPEVKDEVYREHVVSIMLEVASTILLIPGQGFAGIVDRCLAPGGGGLGGLLRRLGTMDPETFVQEELRLAPPANRLLRTATGPTELGGFRLEAGDYVCAVVKSASLDLPHPKDVRGDRKPSAYLHFGPEGGPHRCQGHRLAPSMLAEMFLGLDRLPELTPKASRAKALLGSIPGRLIVELDEKGADPP